MTNTPNGDELLPPLTQERIEEIATAHSNYCDYQQQRDGSELCFHTFSTPRLMEFVDACIKEASTLATPPAAPSDAGRVILDACDLIECQAAPVYADEEFGYLEEYLGTIRRALTAPAANFLDPDMPAQELRLHMGELTDSEILTARAAIRWANTRMTAPAKKEGE
jgi:hypothetical protein